MYRGVGSCWQLSPRSRRCMTQARSSPRSLASFASRGASSTKRVRLESLPERARMIPKSSTPSKSVTYLQHRWTDEETNVGRLLQKVRGQGYTGSYLRLADFIAPWRQKAEKQPTPPSPIGIMPRDPGTGRATSPIIAAAQCINPRGPLTPPQAEKVDILKQALSVFAYMRSLAMRFRGSDHLLVYATNGPCRGEERREEAISFESAPPHRLALARIVLVHCGAAARSVVRRGGRRRQYGRIVVRSGNITTTTPAGSPPA